MVRSGSSRTTFRSAHGATCSIGRLNLPELVDVRQALSGLRVASPVGPVLRTAHVFAALRTAARGDRKRLPHSAQREAALHARAIGNAQRQPQYGDWGLRTIAGGRLSGGPHRLRNLRSPRAARSVPGGAATGVGAGIWTPASARVGTRSAHARIDAIHQNSRRRTWPNEAQTVPSARAVV